MSKLNQAQLKDLLNYDKETGIFTWKERRSPLALAGSIAGCNKDDYVQIGILGEKYQAHRLAWLYVIGEWPENEIDHINHNKSDNRFSNLRLATKTENQRNRKLSRNNKSGVNGVHWSERDKRWISKVKLNGKTKALGSFKCFFEACCARLSANNKYNFHENHGN